MSLTIDKSLIGLYCRSKNNRFRIQKNGCYLCWKNFADTDAYLAHLKIHSKGVKIPGFNGSWKSLRTIEPIDFSVTLNHFELTFDLTNNSNEIIKIIEFAVYNENVRMIHSDLFPITLGIGDKVSPAVRVDKLCDRNHITISYEKTTGDNRDTIQSYLIQKKECSPPARPKHQGTLELGKLSDYSPSVPVKSMFKVQFQPSPSLTGNESKLLKTITEFKGPLTSSNYFDMLTLMVEIEDYGAQLSVARSTKRNRMLFKVKGNQYVLKLEENEGRPLFLLSGDRIWIERPKTSVRTYGFVQHVTSSEIRMTLQTSKAITQSEPIYSIHFEMNRLTYKLQRLALETAKRLDVIDLLFPQPSQLNLLRKTTIPELDIHDKRLRGDTNQREAVQHIVAGTAYPLPYVLIGYPGTGKTATIVESVYQLWKRNPNNRILICAQSNSVCNEIGQRLLASIPTKNNEGYNIIRLFAAWVRKSCNDNDLKTNSNFDEGNIPCLAELYKYRIIIATLTVSGRLLQAGMDANHFTHLFIDECESATEPFTLLPIVLCSSMKKINAHVVISGDPNQLGPVVRERVTQQMAMNISMLQRLNNNPLYSEKIGKKSYDRRITCRLRNNYRSHSDLVHMPNKLFYNNEIKCCIPQSVSTKIRWLSELDFLPRKGFPILFEQVDGVSETKRNCLSWFNEIEVESVLHYVDKLLQNEPRKINQSDIGIIAAYKRQVLNIIDALEERNCGGIEVGTVEQFQGKEKPIIIISTVRNGSIGFVKQRERINVLLTRAIGLLIIIGHAKTLRQSSDWRKVIDHASEKCDGVVVADYYEDVGDYRC